MSGEFAVASVPRNASRVSYFFATSAVLMVAATLAWGQNDSTQPQQQQLCRPGIDCPSPQEVAPPSGRPDVIENTSRDRMQDRRQPVPSEQRRPDDRYARARAPEYTEFQQFVYSTVGKILPMYGYNLFEDVPTTFAPVDRIPVPADYVIGPGDEVIIRGWGQVTIDLRTTVDRTGSIYIPKVGSISIAGLRYDQLNAFLKSAIGRVYLNFDLNTTLGELRSIQVFVVGQARRPGSYTVSSLSTLVNTLFASGGPSPHGSMRHIQLKRGTTTVTEFDLYDLLLRGDKSKDAALLPGDVIYVSAIGHQVAISGSINVPGIYELKGETTLRDLVQLAGGFTTAAAGKTAVVERIENRAARTLEEATLDEHGLGRTMHDGDVVNIVPVSPRFENAVTLRGNVAQPGRYAWRSGLRVSDVIPNREFLITREYWMAQNQVVQPGQENVYAAAANKALAMDKRKMQATDAATLGPDGADRGRDTSSVGRDTSSVGRDTSSVSQDRRTRGDQQAAMDLSSSIADAREPREPDAFPRNDVKRNAPDINWEYAVVQRMDPKDLSNRLIAFNLRKAVIEHDPSENLELQPGDVITVFSQADVRVPTEKQTKFIRLEGEFKASGVYDAAPGETLRDVVKRAGGLAAGAYLFGAEFTRESTRQAQQRSMDQFLDDMEKEIERGASAASRAVINPEDALAIQGRLDGQRRLLAKLRQVRASGRVVLDLSSNAPTVPAMPLEDGDRFYVPARPATISVLGSVYNENSFLYSARRRVADYLSAAGGGRRDADLGHTFIIRADGSVVSKSTQSRWWSGGIRTETLMPGDTVVVPEQLNKTSIIRGLKDWSQIVGQFGLGIAAINVLK